MYGGENLVGVQICHGGKIDKKAGQRGEYFNAAVSIVTLAREWLVE